MVEGDEPKKTEKIGMIFVDIFTKYAQVAVLPSKQNADVLAGLLEGFRKMGGAPQSIYTDEERVALQPKTFRRFWMRRE